MTQKRTSNKQKSSVKSKKSTASSSQNTAKSVTANTGIIQLNHPYNISPELSGGLGNNLFQIAAAYAFAKETGGKMIVEDNFILAPGHKQSISNNAQHLPENITAIFPKIPAAKPDEYFFWNRIVKQKRDANYANVMLTKYVKPTDKNKLVGVYASYQYFKKYAKDIIDMFEYADEIKDYAKHRFASILDNPKTVSIHVRRGDFVRGMKYGSHMYCIIGHQYLKQAIDKMNTINPKHHYVIFNEELDDPFIEQYIIPHLKKSGLAYTHIPYDIPAPVVNYLMTQCKHNILSRSTFGFWGAFLNRNPNKTVIIPTVWKSIRNQYERQIILRGDILDSEHQQNMPPNWIRIPTFCESVY